MSPISVTVILRASIMRRASRACGFTVRVTGLVTERTACGNINRDVSQMCRLACAPLIQF